MRGLCFSLIVLIPGLLSLSCFAQADEAVGWEFSARSLGQDVFILCINANLSPGWHLYSQNMSKGGPRPTEFTFQQGSDVVLIGNTEEKGDQVTLYNDIFEMEITQFTGTVTFSQKIKASPSAKVVIGTVGYMVCNGHLCMPAEQKFSIDLDPSKNP